MKQLEDIMKDMSALYDQVREGKTELKTASELANIAGKYLKARQLDLAERIFLHTLDPAASKAQLKNEQRNPLRRIGNAR